MNSKSTLFFYSAVVSISMLATFACGDDGDTSDFGTGGSTADAGDGGAPPATSGGKGGTGGSKTGGSAGEGEGGTPDEPGTGGAPPTAGNDSTGGRATGGKSGGGGDAGSGQTTGGRVDGGAAGSGGAPAEECDEGYYGPDCQPCDCESGNCEDGLDGDGSCLCPVGYAGANCDQCDTGYQDNDDDGTCIAACSMSTCHSHGSCDDSSGAVVCTCFAGYTAARCTACAEGYQDNDENGTCLRACDDETCNEHGTCADTTGMVACTCMGGYTGLFCDNCGAGLQDNDDDGTCTAACAPETCGENGDCDDDDGSLECICNTGYAGAVCDDCADDFQDNDMNGSCEPACEADSCPEHAVCDDDDGAIDCSTCQTGYEGASCEDCSDGYVDDGDGGCELDPCVEVEWTGALPIPDDDLGGVSMPLVVVDSFPVGKVELTVSVDHDHMGDVAMALQHDAVGPILLHAEDGCGEANWSSVTFDDEALTSVECEPDLSGRYLPDTALSNFESEQSLGIWLVWIRDTAPGEIGSLTYAKIRLCPAEVP